MVWLSCLLSILSGIFIFLAIKDSWTCVFPYILMIVIAYVGQYFEERMKNRIEKLEKDIEKIRKESYK